MGLLIPEKKIEQLIDENGIRTDGRKVDEIRNFKCAVGVLENAEGSAYVEHGGNKIYAAVYGPREVHPRHMARSDRGILKIYYRMSTFSVFERKSPAPNRREQEISMVLRTALEPMLFLEIYPNSAIEVFVEVVAADGGTRCASATAVALALADAGIPMRDLVTGVAVGLCNEQICLDLNDFEDKAGDADIPCGWVVQQKKIALLQFDGKMTPDQIMQAFEYSLKGATEIYAAQQVALREKYEAIRDIVNPPGSVQRDDDEDEGGDQPYSQQPRDEQRTPAPEGQEGGQPEDQPGEPDGSQPDDQGGDLE